VKKLLTVLIGIALVAGSSTAVRAVDIPDEQFVIGDPTVNAPSLGVVIEDSQKLKNTFSTLQAFTAGATVNGQTMVKSVVNCTKVGMVGCERDKFFNYMANLELCSDYLTTDCVRSVEATNSSGKPLNVNYLGNFPSKMPYSFTGNADLNLPSGGSTFLVDIPEAPHAGGSKYLIVAQMVGNKQLNQSKFDLGQFNLGIFAVSLISGDYNAAGPSTEAAAFQALGWVSNMRIPWDKKNNQRGTCAQSSPTECLIAWPLPLDIQFGVNMKFHTRITGWLHGRTSNTTADIATAADGDQLLKVSGRASIVPTVYAWFEKSKLPKSIDAYYKSHPDELNSGSGFGERDPVTKEIPSMMKDTFNYYERELPEALAWYAALGDKAPYAPTQWSIRSTGNGGDPKGCFNRNPGLSGVVSTNSNFFISGPPEFNRTEDSLDYKVASPHFLPNGEVFKGTYNLVITSDVARCLYGFTAAPVSASVSVVSADGTSQVATSILGERNGWLYLTAAGFTFSSPTVRVKLTQQKAASASTSSSSAALAQKRTITCLKGKTSKKVTAISPRCPTGYKKKA
jgi:hypothetical protein